MWSIKKFLVNLRMYKSFILNLQLKTDEAQT